MTANLVDRVIRVMDRIHEHPATVGSRAAVTTGVATVVGATAVIAGIVLSVLIEGITRWT